MATSYTISALPIIHPRGVSPETFIVEADDFVGALPQFRNELNTFGNMVFTNVDAVLAASAAATVKAAEAAMYASAAVMAPGTTATSTTYLTIAQGPQTFTIETGKHFVPGQYVSITYRLDTANSMQGRISSYDPVTGVMIVMVDVSSAGAGPYNSWVIGLNAPVVSYSGGIIGNSLTVSDYATLSSTIDKGTVTAVSGAYSTKMDGAGLVTITGTNPRVVFKLSAASGTGLYIKGTADGVVIHADSDVLIVKNNARVGVNKQPNAALDFNYTINTVSTNTNALESNLYVVTNGSTVTLPVPSAPGAWIRVKNASSTGNCQVVSSGSVKIMSSSDTSLTLDIPEITVMFIYVNPTVGWSIA